MNDDRIIRALLGIPPVDPVMTDASPYPILPWQELAMAVKRNPIEGRPRGEGGGGGIEKEFDKIRQETAGMTRQQRREQMRQQGQQEFDRVQNMSEAEWAAELDLIRGILRGK